ncbi:MAG: ASPIC/UnbV domain-containing protein, partial [Phycisphaerales bacterium]|nr:ASPIC/UnbV domain-containing protein [Phycisphaerales bacterium]
DLVSSGGEIFMNRTKGAGAWLRIALVGLNTGDSRFNALGIGSAIEIRCGPSWQKRHVESPTTHFGLGPHQQADVMRVVWPNGNYQSLEYRSNSKTALAANRTIVEEQTLKGSCPYLYAWNGERFEFVTDVLWRSALGMSIMQGVYGHHGTADDYFKIAGDQIAPDDGFYRLSFTEELWETSYLDLCRLLVVDHPVGTEIYVDEKCLAPPFPPFEIFKVERRQYPVSATDERGRDVKPQLIARDHRYVDGFTPTRYQGIVEPHELVMDLGEFDADARVRLFLQGWLWPTDASTNVAVSQNPNVNPQAPTIQVVSEDGAWRETGIVVGFPSGKSKTITVDLSGAFPTADHRVRLSTNFCIYWDHIFFSVGDQDVETRVTELAVERAELRERGISVQYRRWPGGPRIPDYDVLDSAAQWRDLVGGYTALGDVRDLVSKLDDRYAIVGAGDEVRMWFDANAAPDLPEGWTRDFVVHTDGWLKDGDLNSATGKTVEPLPWREMTAFPPDEEAPERDESSVRNSRFRDQGAFRDAVRK